MSSLQTATASSAGTFTAQTFGQAPVRPRDAQVDGLRRPLSHVRRVVVKLGTRVLVDESGSARLDRLESLARSVANLRARGLEVIVVSSGAVGLGSGLLGLVGTHQDVESRRACAAVGQARLLALYQSAFAVHGLTTAQVLLTCNDLREERRGFVRATFESLLRSGVVPVVNENDAVTLGVEVPGPTRTFQDRVFRDNDGLAAHVASGCDADLLLLLTDVEGVCARDPRRFPGEPVLARVDDAEALLEDLARAAEAQASQESRRQGIQSISRGGMHSKVSAALLATRGACDVVIASGNHSGALERMVSGDAVGTYFPKNDGPKLDFPKTNLTASNAATQETV